jgi:hypothetical protein
MMKTVTLVATVLMFIGCGPAKQPASGLDSNSRVGELGTIEITARLLEIPEGAIFKRDLYDYATVLKYEVTQVHRGELPDKLIYVAQYNPFKSRSDAADDRVQVIGGSLERFVAGEQQRLALDGTVDEQFMGGVVNKYFGQSDDPIYWAIWTDHADDAN